MGERVYIVPMIVFNRQMLWHGESLLPAPLLFRPISYVKDSYTNSVFDCVEKILNEEQSDGDE